HVTLDLLRSPAGQLVVGGTLTRTNGQTTYVVAAFNEQGQTLWRTEHVSTNKSENTLRRIIQDDSGHLLLTGTSDTLKLSPAGAVLWTAPYSGRDVACDTNGHAYLTGYRTDDIALLKLDATAGTNLLERLHDGPRHGDDQGLGVILDKMQAIYVVGREAYHVDRFGDAYRPYLLKYATDGSVLWRQVLPRPFATRPNEFEWGNIGFVSNVIGMIPAITDGIILNLQLPSYAAWLTYSIDASGNLRWHSIPAVPGGGLAAALCLSPDGRVFLTGHASHESTTAYLTLGFEPDGRESWRAFSAVGGPPVSRSGNALVHAPPDEVIVTGRDSRHGEPANIRTIAYAAGTGAERWVVDYLGAAHGHDEGMGVAVDARGAVYVAGHSDNAQGGRDLLLLKYAPAARAQVTPGGDVAVTIPAAPGTPVTLEATTDFAAWSAVGTVLAGTNAAARVVDSNAVQRFPGRFYRPRP
ncbi:MAG TPA: hypothetical protein PKE47_09235, partial [Verrucomicrobiota bacterium]|nr:hypothetical protein [Verrucomicrobiota bacterium]